MHACWERPVATCSLALTLALALALTVSLALGSDWLHAGAWESSPQHRSWPDYPLVVKCLQDCIAAKLPPSRPIEVTNLVNTKNRSILFFFSIYRALLDDPDTIINHPTKNRRPTPNYSPQPSPQP